MSAQQTVTVMNPQATPAVVTPMDMLNQAVASGSSIEVLTKLMDLQERWEKNQARKAFDAAFADAKAEMPVIFKNRTVDFTSQKGRTNYRYEDLAEVVRVVTPILARHGLTHRFRTTAPPNEPVTVTCVISHRDGYYEENSLPGPRDDSGNKNAHQAIGSALTYLQRMTLKAALGLAASEDDDGKTAEAVTAISDDDHETLLAKLEATGSNIAVFCKHFKIEKTSDLPASQLGRATAMLEKKAADKKATAQ